MSNEQTIDPQAVLKRHEFRMSDIQKIKAALVEEAAKRRGRSFEEWTAAEASAVWAATRDFAQQHGLRVPLLEEVVRVETLACGHSDYASKWALYALELAMQPAKAAA